MSRLNLIDPATAPMNQRALLQPLQAKLGPRLPPPVRALANSPAALNAFFGLQAAVGQGELTAKLREQLALAVGNAQGCRYCVAFHTQLGKRAGLSDVELDLARRGRAPAPRDEAALQFARQLAEHRGAVTDAQLAAVRTAGWGDGEITEMLAQVVAITFGNYLNRLARTELDLPEVPLVKEAILPGAHE